MTTTGLATPVASRSPLRRVLGRRVFVVPYLAEAQSILGDQLARVALAVIVLRATGSTPATAAVYAATFLPSIIGGFLLARLGDRFDRRRVMIVCDLFRAVCFGVIAARPHDVPLLVVMVVVSMAVGPVFSAAQLGLLADRVDVDEFTAGNAVRLVSSQAAQVAGFVVGGVIVTILDPRAALLINTATFFVSALVLWLAMPAAVSRGSAAPDSARSAEIASGRHRDDVRAASLWHGAGVRPLVVASLCVGFFVVPEGLAIPFANSVGASAASGGVLLAAGALGGALGAAFLVRLEAVTRARAASLMSVLCGIPLIASFAVATWQLSWWLVAICWLLSGAAAAYVVQMTSSVMHSMPGHLRSRQVGRLSALLLAAQGVAVVGFGVVAAWLSPAAAVGIAGAVGTMVVLGTHWASRRRGSPLARHQAARAVLP